MIPERSGFYPINALFRTDSDIYLFLLSANGVRYSSQINDEWYAAHKFLAQAERGRALYVADETISVLGCTMQHQVCDLGLSPDKRCTQLASAIDQSEPLNSRWERILNITTWVSNSAVYMNTVVDHLGSSSLTSRYSLMSGLQGPLPDNQWQLDVENWHSIVLASFQQSSVRSASGPQDADVLGQYWQISNTKQQKQFCKNQVR